MTKEKFKVDEKLSKEFEGLIREEGGKIAPEEQLRKTLWAFEALKQENKVNSDTTLEELVRVIEERLVELRQTFAYAKETIDRRAGDEIDAELHGIALKEVETSKRLLGYMQAAWFTLKPLSQDNYNSYMTFKDVEARFQREQAAKEFIIDQDEKIRRRENK